MATKKLYILSELLLHDGNFNVNFFFLQSPRIFYIKLQQFSFACALRNVALMMMIPDDFSIMHNKFWKKFIEKRLFR